MREFYNDIVVIWNKVIFEWLIKVMVVFKEGYIIRVLFLVS